MYQQYINQAQASLANLTSDELKDLLNNDDELEERVIQVLSSLESEKDTILSENRSLAEDNLTKEPQLIELRSKISELSEEGKLICVSLQEKLTEIKSKSGSMSRETALALLQTAAAESEEESEKLVKQLLENDVALEAFLEQFLTSRRTTHLRKLKAEKMMELIRQPPQNRNSYIGPSTGFFSPQQPPLGGVPYPISGSSVPYPLGPMPMPMPAYPRPY